MGLFHKNREKPGIFSRKKSEPIWKEIVMFDQKKKEEAMQCIRNAAARDDQEELISIALQAPDNDVRWFATSQVKNEEILKQIACQDRSEEVRSHALCNIHDDAFFAGYALKINSLDLALLCIERIKSQEALTFVASNTDSEKLVNACLKRIQDDGFLVRFVLNSNQRKSTLLCIERVKSQEALARIAVGSNNVQEITACLKRIGNNPSKNTVKTLDKSENQLVQDYLMPHRDAETRNRMVFSVRDVSFREKTIRTLTDYHTLYRCATQDSHRNCRRAAYQTLLKQKCNIPGDWWDEHIDEETEDQRLALWVKNADTDESCAAHLADGYLDTKKAGRIDSSYVTKHCPKAVVELLETRLSTGNTEAAKLLIQIYRSKELNPVLSDYVQAQQKRIVPSHGDAMVDSSVCGETYRHEDYVFDSGILPL